MITIIVLNWNGADDTLACVESLLQLKGPTPNIIICDNDSVDDSFARIRKQLETISASGRAYRHFMLEPGGSLTDDLTKSKAAYIGLVRTTANLGFAGGVNVGLRLALQDPSMRFAWVLNNDTRVDSGALQALIDTLASQPQIGLCGSTLLYLTDPERIQAAGGCYNPWLGITRHLLGQEVYTPERCSTLETRQIDYVVGASMFFRRELLERVGLFSEEYFLYFEELDWVMRMHRLAPEYRLGYSPHSLVFHKEGASVGANDLDGKTANSSSDYYFQTSRLRFARRYYPWRYLLVRMSQIGVALNRIKRGQWASCGLALGLLVGWIPDSLRPKSQAIKA
jgi:GT2 family glycosyltransferase